MIPTFRFGLFEADSSFPTAIERVFGPYCEILTLEDSNGVSEFLRDIGFPEWKVLVLQSKVLKDPAFVNQTSILKCLQISTFHLIVSAMETSPLDPSLGAKDNVHVVYREHWDRSFELEHHLHHIKSVLDSYWLHAKATDVLYLYEQVYVEEPDYYKRIQMFLESLLKINKAHSITVFLLDTGGACYSEDISIGDGLVTSIPRTTAEQFLEFGDTCITQILDRDVITHFRLASSADEPLNAIVITSTFRLEGIPGFIVYTFDFRSNAGLTRVLCGISSREIFHLYRAKQVRSQFDTLKAISEISGIDADKEQVLHKILFKLKAHFESDGVAIVELVFDQNNVPTFEKTFIERANKGITSFPYKGFAQHCVANNKALMITSTEIVGNRPYGIGFEYDPDRLGIDQGKPVRIESLRAPHAFEDERSLMYFPFRYTSAGSAINISGAIKVSNFTRSKEFNLQQLRALRAYADPVASLLGNLESVSKLKSEMEQKSSQEEMLDIGEVLFFYREITLGIFHQVRNHLDTLQSEMLMLEYQTNRVEKPAEFTEHLGDAKVQIKLAKDLISKAHQRGLSLNPMEQTCELLRDVLRPAIEYAKKRTKGTSIDINHSLSKDEYPTKLDIDLAKESFINLLNNSIWAVKSNRTSKKEVFIAVRKSSDGESARIEIDDTGIGIQPDNFKKLFTPGFTTRPGGTGLGLYFTRKLLEYFGGTVEVVKSNPGKGTTVVVTLKLIKEDG